MTQWIDIDKECPNDEVEVLAMDCCGNVMVGYVYKPPTGECYFCENDVENMSDILYWIPIPKKPKELILPSDKFNDIE